MLPDDRDGTGEREGNEAMEIQVNGEKRQWEGPATVLALLAGLGIGSASVAVEKNRRILPREAFATEPLGEGDRLEIIRLVGGG